MGEIAKTWVARAAAVLLVVIVTGAAAPPAHAMTCFADLGSCWGRAASINGFWWRWAAGLDCELSFINCARTDILGH